MEYLSTKPKGILSASLRIVAVAVCMGCFAPAANAADPAKPAIDLPQVVTEAAAPNLPLLKETTHPTIRLSPDDTKLIRLDQDASLVVVGNPEHANVIADSTRTLVIVPRNPGATYFTVMGTDGKIIMRRLLIIAGPEEHYIRVKNTCKGTANNNSCKENNIYYCPDTCHEILLNTESATAVSEQAVPATSNQTAQAQQQNLGGFFTNDDPEEDEEVEDATKKLQDSIDKTSDQLDKTLP
ncbi:MAG: pilus assembly protein N-terminal domain-containing protein [Rhodospirillales bacterium]|nr:pilus assembly protein N-terminal domain-containing protein [Alphaproteobacteria bacterium]MCB9977638.1 pilus assembly protein N-terminal domain-containing protein [Rhodospirillales bacterium]